MSTEKTPFRTDIGMDQNGYYCIKLGHTIYAVRENQVFTVFNGQYKAVPAEVLAEKAWIMRNINEVIGQEFKALVTGKTENGYIIQVNGKDYEAVCTFFPTMNLDKEYDQVLHGDRAFNWSDLCELDSGAQVEESLVLQAAFKREVKRALNYQRKTDLNRFWSNRKKEQKAALAATYTPWAHSKHEAREYNNRKYNTDAFGIEFK